MNDRLTSITLLKKEARGNTCLMACRSLHPGLFLLGVGMRDKCGRFIKGSRIPDEWIKRIKDKLKNKHLSPATEFKKGHNKGHKKGHNIGVKFSEKTRKKMSESKKSYWRSRQYPRYKNGRKIKFGYILVYKPERASCVNNKYIPEHRLIVEKQIGRYLAKEEICHHINKIRNDNRIENLMVFASNPAHHRFHGNPNRVKPEEIIFDGREPQPPTQELKP